MGEIEMLNDGDCRTDGIVVCFIDMDGDGMKSVDNVGDAVDDVLASSAGVANAVLLLDSIAPCVAFVICD